MATNHYPDGLTIEAITALQREVNDELRREGYPVRPEQPTFVSARPTSARRLQANRSSTRPNGSPTRLLATGDGPARSLRGPADNEGARPSSSAAG
ncbi:hypothetical protein SacmaDRAFT_0020 [Saccharomonospora marina XMU15]|uniref:Uncharacterized protein n=1 Tax=Saccharomonospora marina XMU15 TaxID=882083 RepID=H5WX65_9PSEU|nr:hypothetical protein SacmaDRAFT_0020 [Saccharomonospora marina XMU15]